MSDHAKTAFEALFFGGVFAGFAVLNLKSGNIALTHRASLRRSDSPVASWIVTALLALVSVICLIVAISTVFPVL
jgi:hypothetical protein